MSKTIYRYIIKLKNGISIKWVSSNEMDFSVERNYGVIDSNNQVFTFRKCDIDNVRAA